MTKKPRYFTRFEWSGFWITTLVSFGVYLFTLAPNVTLEDSGEFLTAAYHWGVPHPPGYPVWAISANLFELLIPFGNAAWRVNMVSAFYGALATGMLCLLTSKLAIRVWSLERFKDFTVPGVSREAIALMAGIVGGLIFAFIDTMWSQAVIAEVYTLNAFFFTALCLIVLRWFDSPEQWRWPCLLAWCFGLGITNHQTLLVSAPAFLFTMYVVDRALYRDTVLLASIACSVVASQSQFWFLWLFVIGFLLHYVYLMGSDSRAWTMRSLFTAAFSVMLGVLAMAMFAEKADRPNWLFLGGVLFVTWTLLLVYELALGRKWFNMASQLLLSLLLLGLALFALFFGSDITNNPGLSLLLGGGGLVIWVIVLIYNIGFCTKTLHASLPFVLSFFMFVAGASLYLYMPISSYTNPPMNWGYTRTLEGFHHHITRGQYQIEQLKRSPEMFIGQLNDFFKDLKENFSLPLALLGVLPLIFFPEFMKKEKFYLVFTVLCFIFMGFFLVYLLNPRFDEQSRYIIRVFYSLAHGVYALWIGLGTVFLLYLVQRAKRKLFFLVLALLLTVAAFIEMLPSWKIWEVHFLALGIKSTARSEALWLAIALLCLPALGFALRRPGGGVMATGIIYMLPIIPLTMNWADSEMRGHEFGWRYGRDMLKGLDRNAVVYGGTDPGRFIPTYMIFVESFQPDAWKRDPTFDRRDLYIITQNALADQTYMHYIRDHYDVSRPKMDQWYHRFLGRHEQYPREPLCIPSLAEFDEIFHNAVQAAGHNPNSGVTVQRDPSGRGARISVQGLEGVFTINGGIAQWIFEKNKNKHTFYVEESWAIQWMYPYLEPAGLIMKLNKEPLKALDPKIVAQDMAYWSRLCAELMSDPAFCRDISAYRSFSKLRSSIGGLYSFRGIKWAAEKAYRQALDLYSTSGEARSRLVELHVTADQFEEAFQVAREWRRLDPDSSAAADSLNQVIQLRALFAEQMEMASLYEFCKDDPEFIFQYAGVLRDRNKMSEADKVVDEFLGQKIINLNIWEKAIQFYADAERPDRIEGLLTRLSQREPKNAVVWYNLAAIQSELLNVTQACTSLEKAISCDKNVAGQVRNDVRFNNIRATEQYQKLVK